MLSLFYKASEKCSQAVTNTYSTSFASSIRMLHKDLHNPIFGIYGFVRLADEIVDTFHDHDKAALLQTFKEDTYKALREKISLNPILHNFQATVSYYQIDEELIHAFFKSMEMDLHKKKYDQAGFEEYIYGSAEVVGLMCLYVFCDGNKEKYKELKQSARYLGAAFQKVNFLRDLQADYNGLARMYFPGCDFADFKECDKSAIEEDILNDFKQAYKGIVKLPLKARFGVYVAYKYYLSLFKKIKRTNAKKILQERIRIPNYYKTLIVLRAGVKNQLNLIG